MSTMDFHLYLIFILDQNYFGINIKNLVKLYRTEKSNAPGTYLIRNNGEEKLLPVINIKHVLFLNNQKEFYLKKPEFETTIPTLIELESPLPDLCIHRMGIIVDFVIGLQQVPPDDFIDPVSESKIPEKNQMIINPTYIMAHCSAPVTNQRNQVIETPIHIIHVDNLFIHSVIS